MKSLIVSRCLRNPHRAAHGDPRQRAKLPKRTDEATCVLAFFAIAAAERISEKNRRVLADFDS
jgi:hypothetical protein